MNLFSITFPLSIYLLIFGFIVGVGISIFFFASFSMVVIILLLYIGSIRIMPIMDIISTFLLRLFPTRIKSLIDNLRKSFPIYYSNHYVHNKQYIYCFHPHGLFTISHYLHIGTNLTDWKDKNSKGTALHLCWYLPFGKEFMETYHFVQSNYEDMKQVLLDRKSLSVTLGGVKEVPLSKKNKMILNIAKKRGVFKMAMETGIPIVPIVVYGENELYELYDVPILQSINNLLLKFNLFLPIPTLQSCIRWLSLYKKQLEQPVQTYVGKPIIVEKKENPTEDDIIRLREQYFSELRILYKNTRPEYYDKELYII